MTTQEIVEGTAVGTELAPPTSPATPPAQAYRSIETNYVPALVMQPEQAKALMQQLDDVKKSVMREGVDYAVIEGTSKPSLLQPGGERLAQMFGLGVRAEIVERFTVDRAGNDTDEYGQGWGVIASARATKTIHGHEVVVSESTGYAGNDEMKWRKAPLHTLMMMAQKRAKLAATRSATGASELFTQDVEDMSPEQLAGTAGGGGGKKELTWPFGDKKGTPLSKMSDADLNYMVGREIKDDQYKKKNEEMRAACLAILQTRKGAAAPPKPGEATNGLSTPTNSPSREHARLDEAQAEHMERASDDDIEFAPGTPAVEIDPESADAPLSQAWRVKLAEALVAVGPDYAVDIDAGLARVAQMEEAKGPFLNEWAVRQIAGAQAAAEQRAEQ